jgi:hypothetical protein
VAYIVVSDRIGDTFPVIDRPPSPYRLLATDHAFSLCTPGTQYVRASAWVDRAVSLGMRDMIQVRWGGHKWPFNLNDPDSLPAPPAVPCGVIWGTTQQWLDYADKAADANWARATCCNRNKEHRHEERSF